MDSTIANLSNPPLHLLWDNRTLIRQLIKRDILSKYRGSFIGLMWVILNPLLMLSLYTLAFGLFMRVQWPGVTNNLIYALIIYTGLIILNFFSECLIRSTSIIISNPNFVKKIIFPLEIYPIVIVGSALVHTLINSSILALFSLGILGSIHWTMLLLPIIFLPLILMTLGISWFLCSMGVFVRDLSHIMGPCIQMLMYLSPIFYSVQMLPSQFQKILLINPLTFIMEQARQIIIFGNWPDWQGLGYYALISTVVAYLGFIWFARTKDGFADEL